MRDQKSQKLLNSKRWKETRIAYLQAHPLCERCEQEGFVRAAVDVHHRRPISASMTQAEMERLCFDVSNLQALCIPCHIKTHQELGKNTKANMQARAAQRMSRWSESIRRPAPQNPLTVDLVSSTSESEISWPSSVLRG